MSIIKVDYGSVSGGGASDSGIETLSTSANTTVNLSFAPKAIYYTTQDTSGTGATYYMMVWWSADNPTKYCYMRSDTLAGKIATVGVVDTGGNPDRGELMDVGSNYFEVGHCDSTGFGTTLNWYAYG